jgi:pimeloyl-ACP methyl ester carboxylesterase
LFSTLIGKDKTMNHSKALVGNYGESDIIICLHSSLGSAKQWSGLMAQLGDSCWFTLTDQVASIQHQISLEEEVQSVVDFIESQGKKAHLIGHSFGASVALKVAQANPENLASVVLIEPISFNLLPQVDTTDQHLYQQLNETAELINLAVKQGHSWSMTKKLINGLNGQACWEKFSTDKKLSLVNNVDRVPQEIRAILNDQSDVGKLQQVSVPVLILCGTYSPNAIKRISCLLNDEIEQARHRTLAFSGHLLPITHEATVTRHIFDHFDRYIKQDKVFDSAANRIVNF